MGQFNSSAPSRWQIELPSTNGSFYTALPDSYTAFVACYRITGTLK
ncbi:MAG: hypothetical protein ACUVRD_08625 [Bacteroidia bacterium]